MFCLATGQEMTEPSVHHLKPPKPKINLSSFRLIFLGVLSHNGKLTNTFVFGMLYL
jgi:hypothetical protein